MGFSLKPFTKILISAGIFLFIVGMIGSCAYNAVVSSRSPNKILTYGRNGAIYQALLATCVLAAICGVVFVVALVFMIIDIKDKITLILYIVGLVFFVGVLIAQSITVDFLKYGGAPIPGIHNYYETNKKFKEYADKYNNVSPAKILQTSNISSKAHSRKSIKDPGDFEEDGYEFYYFVSKNDGQEKRVESCINVNSYFTINKAGTKDCSCTKKDGDYTCIGGWTPMKYCKAMCATTVRGLKLQEKSMKLGTVDKITRFQATFTNDLYQFDTPSANYLANSILLGINITAFILLLVGMILNFVAGGKGVASA